MLVNKDTAVLVQGITGKQGSYWSQRMLECGTRIVAGVTPGKGGQSLWGIPIYHSVAEAVAHHAVDLSVLFVPPLAIKPAAVEAMEAGIKRLVILAEHVPLRDTMELLAVAEEHGARILGPNSPGVMVPGEAMVGILPGWLEEVFRPGRVGVVSRSGSLGTLVCLEIARAGLGQSAFVGIGGDPIVGTTFVDVLRWFEQDPRTSSIVLLGEIGGTAEEEAAEFLPSMNKPVFALIAGRCAPPGKRMGHAGAIVEGERGTTKAKIEALQRAGAYVASTSSQLVQQLISLE